MIETTMAESEVMYSFTASFVIHSYSKLRPSSSLCQYSMIKTGVMSTTEISKRKTQRITVLVVPMTESFVKSSQMMSD